VIKQCSEDQLLSKLGLVLFEQLDEEYPDTSIIAAEGAITNVVGMMRMNPLVKDLCELIFIIPQRSLLMLLNYSAPNDGHRRLPVNNSYILSYLSNTSRLPSATTLMDRKRSPLALAIPGRPVIPRSISRACTVLIDIE